MKNDVYESEEDFKDNILTFKFVSKPENEVLKQAILTAHNHYRRVLEVAEFYKQYLIDKGYTGVQARLVKNHFTKSMQLFGFSADQKIVDENFNGVKTKFNTNYYPLKKTKFNKEHTEDFSLCHTSYNDVCELMTGRISADQYKPSKFDPKLGTIFMIHFNYVITSDKNTILFVAHKKDINPVDKKLIANEERTFVLKEVENEVYKFVMGNFEVIDTKY